jgi:hypothetical protein
MQDLPKPGESQTDGTLVREWESYRRIIGEVFHRLITEMNAAHALTSVSASSFVARVVARLGSDGSIGRSMCDRVRDAIALELGAKEEAQKKALATWFAEARTARLVDCGETRLREQFWTKGVPLPQIEKDPEKQHLFDLDHRELKAGTVVEDGVLE